MECITYYFFSFISTTLFLSLPLTVFTDLRRLSQCSGKGNLDISSLGCFVWFRGYTSVYHFQLNITKIFLRIWINFIIKTLLIYIKWLNSLSMQGDIASGSSFIDFLYFIKVDILFTVCIIYNWFSLALKRIKDGHHIIFFIVFRGRW